ncbi:MAG: AI-2E family transporter [Clostridiales bacterium]|nr:AI-2E family transporter [Clostridiales bacterium]
MSDKQKKIVLKTGLLLFFILLLFFAFKIKSIVFLFFFALLLAYILHPFGNFLVKKRIPLVSAIVLVYLLMAGLLYLLLFIVAPGLLAQLNALIEYLPELSGGFDDWRNNFLPGVKNLRLPDWLAEGFAAISSGLEQKLALWLQKAATSVIGAFRCLPAVLLAPILSYYMLRDKELFLRQAEALLPPRQRPEILRLAGDVNHLLRSFFIGYLLVSFFIGFLTFLALLLLGVRYALLLGVVMAVANLNPFFGPFIGAAPAVLLAFLQKPLLALYVVIAVFIIQQFEGAVLAPKIIGGRIGLHPLTVIFVILAGGYYFSVFGMILAVPAAATIKLVFSYAYSRAVSWENNKEAL